MTLFPTIALLLTLQTPASAPASIAGIVVRAGTNEPIPRVRITIFGSGLLGDRIPAVTSDDQGRFLFKDLGAGTYTLTAQRNGFSRQQYGERGPGRGRTPITLSAGQALNDIVFRLVPAGAISGRVTDTTGEPLLGVHIHVLRASYDGHGKRILAGIGNQDIGDVRTDDRGEYRAYMLPPGRYYLQAAPDLSFPGEVSDRGYVPAYYPNTTDSSSASPIEVTPGAEVHAIDITLREQKLFRLRGRVFDPKIGKPPFQPDILLIPRNSDGGVPRRETNYNPANGAFELSNVPPGSYWTSATQLGVKGTGGASLEPGDISLRSVRMPIDVSDSDIDNIALTFAPDISMRGRISVEDGSPLPTSPDITQMMVHLEPDPPTESVPFPSPTKPDGTFVIENIQPGDYRIRVGPLRPNYYMKSAYLGQTEALKSLAIPGPVSDDLELVLANDAGRIEGTLLDKDRKPVSGVEAILVPDGQRDRRDLYKTSVVDQNGHFTMETVVPGNYKLFAWEDSEPSAYMDPDFLRKYEESGTPVHISASETVTVEAKIIPAGQ